MSRIGSGFQKLKAKGEGALVVFIAAGDPDLETTRALVPALAAAGADVVELGVPFGDPLADGPSNQAAYQRALEQGVDLGAVLETVSRIRLHSQVPLVLMTYYNPVFAYGPAEFARQAAQAGVDGVLITDLPPEEAGEWKTLARDQGLDTIFLLAPTSTEARIREATALAEGFVYCVARTGVTGKRTLLDTSIRDLVERIRAHTDLPVVVGFGIARPEDVERVTQWADGAVVGSAIVDRIAEMQGGSPEQVLDFVKSLKAATRQKDGHTA